MTTDRSAWAHDGVLWNIGARFIGARLGESDASIDAAIEDLVAHVPADFVSVSSVDHRTLTASRVHHWVRDAEVGVDDDFIASADPEFVARFLAGDGTELATIPELLGEDTAEERGWSDGSAVISLIDRSETATFVLVVAGSETWRHHEVDLLRGFATLVRQFLARVRVEQALGYRLEVEDLVASTSARLMNVDADDCERVVEAVLRDVHRALRVDSAILVDLVDDSTIEIRHIVAQKELPDVFRRFEIPDLSVLPGGEGLTISEFLAEPRIFDTADLVESLAGPETVDALELRDVQRTVALLPALIRSSGTSVIALSRNGTDADWLPEEFDAMTTIASVIALARGRVAAEADSKFRLEAQRTLAETAAAFLTVTAAGADIAIIEALERVGTQLGADFAVISTVDDANHRFVVKRAWSNVLGEIDPDGSVFIDADNRWIDKVLAGETIFSVEGAESDNPAFAEALETEEWSFATAPIRDDAAELSTIGFVWANALEASAISDLVVATADLVGQLWIRLRAEAEVADRLALDEVLSQVADEFLGASATDHDVVVQEALCRIGRHLGLAGASVRRIEGEMTIAEAVFTTTGRPQIDDRQPLGVSGQADRLMRGEWVHLYDPPQAWMDSLVERWGFAGSMVSGPVVVGSETRAALSGMRSDSTVWTSVELEAFRSLAAMLGQFRGRVAAERRDERQLAAQRVLAECAVELAEARSDDLEARTRSVSQRVGRFLELESLDSWRIRHDVETYERGSGWSAGAVAGGPVPWGTAPALDEARRTGRRVVIEVDDPSRAEPNTVAISRGDDLMLVATRRSSGAWRADAVQTLDALNSTIHQVEKRVAAERYADAAFAGAPIGVVLRDSRLRIVTCNQAFADFIGADSIEELIGTFPQEVYDEVFEDVAWVDKEGSLSGEAAFRRRTGGRVWGQMRASFIDGTHDDERLWLIHVEDVTERRRAEQLLRFQASHDELTGLANRRELLDEVRRVVAGSGSVAVLLLDLDRFKLINDSLGHDRGDELLVVVADRLRLAVRPGDLVARLGGDEFAVLLPGPVTVGEAEYVADRLLRLIGDPVRLGSQEMFPTASIGIAVADDGVAVSDLLRRADTAMYRAKSLGRARHEAFDEELRDEVMARMATEAGLRGALRNDELTVYYQPEVDLRTGQVLAAEALVRWNHPERGLLAAAQFIEIAEETGLVVDLGAIVLSQACNEAMSWPGGDDAPLLRVNLSAAQIQRDDTIGVVRGALAESGLPASRLCLEITESAVMNDLDRSGETLARLKELGLILAVDDFGTGFSSLAYLKMFPVDVLKIDRAFVSGLGGDSEDTAFVRSIVSLAEALGLEVVAEGVETEEQAAALLELGCTRAQGYLFARPGPASDLRARLADG